MGDCKKWAGDYNKQYLLNFGKINLNHEKNNNKFEFDLDGCLGQRFL